MTKAEFLKYVRVNFRINSRRTEGHDREVLTVESAFIPEGLASWEMILDHGCVEFADSANSFVGKARYMYENWQDAFKHLRAEILMPAATQADRKINDERRARIQAAKAEREAALTQPVVAEAAKEEPKRDLTGLDVDDLYILTYAIDGYISRLPDMSVRRRLKAHAMRDRVRTLISELENVEVTL